MVALTYVRSEISLQKSFVKKTKTKHVHGYHKSAVHKYIKTNYNRVTVPSKISGHHHYCHRRKQLLFITIWIFAWDNEDIIPICKTIKRLVFYMSLIIKRF